MNRFAERLSWAMKCAGFDPAKDQSRIAELVGKPCKPQNIQHLLDPNNEVENTKYLLDLSLVLGCDPFWLGRNIGVRPEVPGNGFPGSYLYQQSKPKVVHIAAEDAKPYRVWPFKSFTIEEFNQLDEGLKQNFEAIIFASIGNRGHPEKHETPANHRSSV